MGLRIGCLRTYPFMVCTAAASLLAVSCFLVYACIVLACAGVWYSVIHALVAERLHAAQVAPGFAIA